MTAESKQTAKAKVIDRAAVDPNLSSHDFRVLGVLLQHLNLKDGLCFPGADRVAAIMKVKPRTVYRSTRALRKHGYLTLKKRRNTSPLYSFPDIQDMTPEASPKSGHDTSVTPDMTPVSVLDLTPVSHKPIEEENLLKSNFKSAPKRRSRTDATHIGEFNDQYANAARDIGITEKKAREIFPAFTDYHTAKGTLSASWLAHWRTWCRNHIKFSKRDEEKASAPKYWAMPGSDRIV